MEECNKNLINLIELIRIIESYRMPFKNVCHRIQKLQKKTKLLKFHQVKQKNLFKKTSVIFLYI